MKLETRHGALIFALLAAAVAIAVYVNSFANGFALDDVFIIEMNDRAHDPLDWRSIWLRPYWPFYGRELGLYRPLTIFLYSIQWVAGGGEAWLFHVTTVVLHALATVLGFRLLLLLAAPLPAFAGALVFAVHPVHTEAVANIVGQAEVVAALFVIGACLLHATRAPGVSVSWPRRALLALLYLAALATKESTVVLPALLVMLDFATRRVRVSADSIAAYVRAMAMPVFLLTAALALYLVFRFDVMSGALTGLDAAPAMPFIREEYRVLNALRAFPEYLRLLFFPQELSSDYSPAVLMPVEDVRPMVILGALLLLMLAGFALATPWLPAVGFPAGWFLITMLTVSNLFFPVGIVVAERTLYLPSLALAALIAMGATTLAPRVSPAMRRLAPAALLLAVALMGWRTWIRNPDWKDTPTVWDAVYRDHPHSYRAQWVRGALENNAGNVNAAVQHYRMAYTIYTRDSQFNADYANFLMGLGQYEHAVALLEESFKVHDFIASTPTMLGFAYVATGRYHDALAAVQQADDRNSNLVTTMVLRSYAFRGLGRYDEAVAALRVATAHHNESSWRERAFIARALAMAGRRNAADAAFDTARALAPDSSRVIVDRARAAMHDGCYDRQPGVSAAPDGFGGVRAECDPLGEWFAFAAPAQNAMPLQNAMPGTSAGRGAEPSDGS